MTPSVKRYTENDSNRYFHLTWNPPGEAHLIHGYHVEQTLVGSSLGWMRLNDNILQSREYVVTDLEPGQCYKYRIVVVTDEAEYRGGKTDPKKAMRKFSISFVIRKQLSLNVTFETLCLYSL